eukprot:CAMPEP_0201484328 /NCGR_PEP_ID=MMETSP0151_2-20130828/8529_1 /ASSEMBLY_ACC=CAM_ASM_000257 /TAXON_ID=200890 /ORGANISM="Paramoeba atlantica, Strain 621/1 / CCAP 1560/9" /LENGTH=107 /DNA_ID=CAMNT_0047867953 /DNA_START=1 /DNA_END=324 /DNA_ORIENTATION=+
MAKVAEVDAEKNQTEMTLEALRNMEAERRCHRLVDGILIEGTARDTIPELEDATTQMERLLKILQEQLERKSQALREYAAEHNLEERLGSNNVQKDETSTSTPGVLA